MLSAFTLPLEAPTEMVRFTFVVGGGKLVRSKYDEDLPKWITASLREIGFSEDRSAALDFSSQGMNVFRVIMIRLLLLLLLLLCILLFVTQFGDCSVGTYKQQHDTGQNLKTISVFPRVTCSAGKQGGGVAASADKSATGTKTPEYIIAASELDTFKEIVLAKTHSWKQKKKLLKVLQDSCDYFQTLEAKLIRGELLDATEQATYDANTGQDEHKLSWLQAEIKHHVDSGNITEREKAEIMSTIDANITTVVAEIEKATSEAKPKKVTMLEEKRRGLVERRGVIQNIQALSHHRLKHGDEIQKLRVKILCFGPLEDKQRAQGLTLEELKILEPKPDIEASIAGLEQASRGWFEEDEEFKMRCDYEERQARSKFLAKKKTASATKKSTTGSSARSGSSSNSSIGAWSTAGAVKKKSSTSSSSSQPKGGAGGFAAAFATDFDSDDSDS